MKWYTMEPRAVEQALETNMADGLSFSQVERRLREKGENTIRHDGKKQNIILRFFAQLQDFMVIVLLCAAAVSAVVSWMGGEKDFVDSAIILLIVLINAVIGVFQEGRAEKAIEALKKLSSPHARVLREGKIEVIEAAMVVPGDILLLEAGDYVCADARLMQCVSLQAEESAITGESVSVEKLAQKKYKEDTPLGDRKNMVLATSFITYGKGTAIVTGTGMETEVGRIARLMIDEKEGQTPLQKRLAQTGQTLGSAAVIICAVIFILGILRRSAPFEMFMTSISLAVAAIPEGLPAIVTIVLALGMQAMSRKNAIVRKLPAVETLGSATVICSDKTGTLTQNKMKVVSICDWKEKISDNIGKRKFILLLAALCNDSFLQDAKLMGEPTEVALAQGYAEAGGDVEKLSLEYPRVGEIPFSSERKRMTTVHKLKDRGYLSVTKGAPDVLMKRCRYCLENGKVVPFDTYHQQKAKALNDKMAQGALRVLAFAYQENEMKPTVLYPQTVEKDLIFAGLAGMIDPPRPEAASAVKTCMRAGIKPVMITGDHSLTATAIGKELGIFQDGDGVVTGEELERLSEEELGALVSDCSVFARVSPAHKVRIVKAFQNKGNVVAMTGDGVNDAPALRAADIGCAMGKNGTDVAKAAAAMVLTDDNFATIVEAVREGRRIYANIRKSVHFLISSNVGEIITIFAAMCFGWATPLLPIQLLWVNLVTDSLPAIALGMDDVEDNVMEKKPKPANESLFAGGMGERIALEGFMIGLLALIAFGIGHIYFDKEVGYGAGRTMAFAVLSISQLVHAFNMRSEQSIFSFNLLSNHFLVISLLVGILMQWSVIMIAPLSVIFKVIPLNLQQWLIVGILCIVPVLVVEIEKFLWNKKNCVAQA